VINMMNLGLYSMSKHEGLPEARPGV